LPWMGYFDLIDRSDSFVFLDDAQFSKQSWHQRNRIVGNAWVTLPIPSGNSKNLLCNVSLGKDKKAYEKIYNKISSVYMDYPYYHKYWPKIKSLIEVASTQSWALSEINIEIIKYICGALNINTKIYYSSQFKTSGARSEKLVNIIKLLNGSGYISAVGASEYLKKDRRIFEEAKIPVFLHEVDKYASREGELLSYLSIIDTLFKEDIFGYSKLKKGRIECTRLI